MSRREQIIEELGIKTVRFRMLTEGEIRRVDIMEFDDRKQMFSEEMKRNIADNWSQMKAKNPTVFSGSMASVKSLELKEGVLRFRLRLSSYDEFVYLRQFNMPGLDFFGKETDKGTTLPLSIGLVAVTDSDSIVLGERNFCADWSGMFNTLPSGYLDPYKSLLRYGDPGDESQELSLDMLIYEELKEEVGMNQVTSRRWHNVVYATEGNTQPLLAGTLHVPYTDQEIKDFYLEGELAREVRRMHFVPNNLGEMAKFMKGKKFTPHAEAQIVAHFENSI
ncbi:MAG: hypothetical protein PHG66_02955 [Candidatus Colwellbacteria bacterium]|nr:hypothetical protein [Candidatus Colwellbacteria bacterium]